MALRFKLFTFTSKDKSASLLEFNISPESPARAVSRRIGFQQADRERLTPRPRRFTAFSLFELFQREDES